LHLNFQPQHLFGAPLAPVPFGLEAHQDVRATAPQAFEAVCFAEFGGGKRSDARPEARPTGVAGQG
jgi:hypothetical protein